eukprot:m.30414 g.30414  ORF g.30414 m.30414 type:complete len:120 (+) comp9275_c0_seq1:210-569(+)
MEKIQQLAHGAVALEQSGDLQGALNAYMDTAQAMFSHLKEVSDSKRSAFKATLESYLGRAEELKSRIKDEAASVRPVARIIQKTIEIEEGATGFDYEVCAPLASLTLWPLSLADNVECC